MNKLVSILLTRLSNSIDFKIKPYRTVRYQESDPDFDRVKAHVKFEPVIYEKGQDLKRNYKFSVS